jgi:hypothetical protein
MEKGQAATDLLAGGMRAQEYTAVLKKCDKKAGVVTPALKIVNAQDRP